MKNQPLKMMIRSILMLSFAAIVSSVSAANINNHEGHESHGHHGGGGHNPPFIVN